MAGAVESRSPVALLEDAAHLLRRASVNDLLCHWVGSAPLALFLLVFWEDASHLRLSDAGAAGRAMEAALLLVWMNCWRSVFAGRLSRRLNGAPAVAWDGRKLWRLVATQAVVGATKLLALPVAFLALFPFPAIVAAYRSVPVLAGRGDLEPGELFRKARQLGRGDGVQIWLLQFLLLLLSLVVLANVAVTFILLPQLTRMLTGIESTFARTGSGFAENRLFLLAVLAATWLLFDPFVQAVYCVRCFERESVETGEDLRSGLRRLRAAALAGIVALLAIPIQAADAVSPADLERAVRDTMQAPEYNWRIPPPPQAPQSTPWIVQATDRALEAVRSAMKWLGRMVDRLLRWIFGGPELGPMPLGGRTPGMTLHWSVWAGLVTVVALAGFVVARMMAARRKTATAAAPAAGVVRIEDDALTADRLPEDAWLEMADRYLAQGELRLGVRALYLANLAWLGRERYVTIQPGRTNRQFEVELRRRARHSAEAREAFAANVRTFERVWYGMHTVELEETAEFRRRMDQMKLRLSAGAAA